jgi:hypothetical protein
MMISKGNITDLEASRDDTVIAPLKMANEKKRKTHAGRWACFDCFFVQSSFPRRTGHDMVAK